LRQRIMDGAISELNERGLKFTMDDLARRLGMSKRTLYDNFSSKEDLIGSLLAQAVAEVKEKREVIAKNNTLDICEKFKQVMTVRTSIWNEKTDHALIDIKKSMPEQWRKIEDVKDELWGTIENIIREGVRTGCFRPVFIPAVRAVFSGAFNEFSNYQFLLKNKVTMKEMVDYTLDILMYGLVVQENRAEKARGN